jgi:hypothetical protein
VTKLKDFNEVIDRLILPINGKEYEIPLITVEGRARWEQEQARKDGDGVEPLSDDEFEHIFAGDVIDQMRADNVPDFSIQRALQTAFMYAIAGVDSAEIMWETGGSPKAIEALVQARLPNRASRRSKSTAAATTTRRPASGSGTKPHRK